uniref:Uncharacterized protein n=1 Tax=Micrurus lemniscatus lemniscatus TaxID=129467 RepID=A0A2D4H5H5_MICLE
MNRSLDIIKPKRPWVHCQLGPDARYKKLSNEEMKNIQGFWFIDKYDQCCQYFFKAEFSTCLIPYFNDSFQKSISWLMECLNRGRVIQLLCVLKENVNGTLERIRECNIFNLKFKEFKETTKM